MFYIERGRVAQMLNCTNLSRICKFTNQYKWKPNKNKAIWNKFCIEVNKNWHILLHGSCKINATSACLKIALSFTTCKRAYIYEYLKKNIFLCHVSLNKIRHTVLCNYCKGDWSILYSAACACHNAPCYMLIF